MLTVPGEPLLISDWDRALMIRSKMADGALHGVYTNGFEGPILSSVASALEAGRDGGYNRTPELAGTQLGVISQHPSDWRQFFAGIERRVDGSAAPGPKHVRELPLKL
jgi:hypothetical protein